MKEDLATNKHIGERIDCACRECHRTTKHEVIADAVLNGSDGDDEFSIGWITEYQIVRCLGCETMSFRRTASSSEDTPIQIGPQEWVEDIHEEIFPSPLDGRQPLADSNLLPSQTRRIYDESLEALNHNQNVLSGIGIRAIVETVCKDKNAPGKDLFAQINSLVGLGVLTQDGAAILHKLRTLGNSAAHEVKPHTAKELGLAFDVIDHLLLGVYILPEHAKRTFK